MPDSLTRSDRKILITAGGLALFLTIASAALMPGDADTDDVPTTYSVASGGAKAAYLLLSRSGYAVTRWEQSLTKLATGQPRTLILVEPQGAPTKDERAAVAQFIRDGGRVVATGAAGALFLPMRSVVPDPVAGLTWKRIPSRAPALITRSAQEITLAPAAYWSPSIFAQPLYGAGELLHVIKYSFERGEVIWWASATPLTNAGLSEPGNLEFFLACVGDAQRAVLWDEYFHGHRPVEQRTLATSAFIWIGAPGALLAAAVLITYSRRSGPIVSPPADSRLSPLEFVRTLGAVYERAGAASVAVDIAYQRFRYRLSRRLGIASDSTPAEIARAVRSRWRLEDPEGALEPLLERCEGARRDGRLSVAEALSLNQSLSDFASKLDLSRPSAQENA